jgi:DNA-binding transcriptional LysR family regulator
MPRENINDLLAFLAVARERSFTRAAAKLGVSQSALSHTVRGLEERLGLRLLTRTTRSVAPTDAGERLVRSVWPRFEEVGAELAALSELREKPAGTIRIAAGEHATETILWPALATLLPDYPDIKLEISIDNGLTDIVAERCDACSPIGVRPFQATTSTTRAAGNPRRPSPCWWTRCATALELRAYQPPLPR